MHPRARTTAFASCVALATATILWSASAASKDVFDASGDRVGTLHDGPDGSPPIVQPAAHHPTLEDLVLRASQCPIGKDGAHTFTFELEFHASGDLASVRILNADPRYRLRSQRARPGASRPVLGTES